MPEPTSTEVQILQKAERLLVRLRDGRYVVATFVAVTPGPDRREPLPPMVTAPSFMDVRSAVELIAVGECGAYADIRQITD
jgi:hypothetical protein